MTDVLQVGVFFGGRSVEHEVSVVTAQQVMAALPADRYHSVPIYIAKSGRWYTGAVLRDLERFREVDRVVEAATEVRMDARPGGSAELHEVRKRSSPFGGGRAATRIGLAMPLIHGSHGEDGTLQGLFELGDMPYTGSGVAASAVSMDKPLGKAVMRGAGLPVIDHVLIERARWKEARDVTRRSVLESFAYPVFVKPASLGSSIGVSRAADDSELDQALDLAFVYDMRCLVEPAQEGAIDVNCSVLGHGSQLQTSVCEQPVSTGVLTYADKYLTKAGPKTAGAAPASGMKGARRLIPAPLDDNLTASLQEASRAAFTAIGAAGVARVDFLVRPQEGTFAVNEVNTIPGSLGFYLWEASGMAFPELLAHIVEIAQQRHAEKAATTFSIDTWLLRGRPD